MTFSRLAVLTIALSFCSSARGGGPESASWDRVLTVTPGTRVEVIYGSLKRLQGDVVSVSPDEIVVQGEGPEQ